MNIGLIAHDAKKKLMQNFCIAYKGILSKHNLSEQQLGAQIENNEIDLVIFLRDPLTRKNHEPDADKVMRLCDMHNIPLATNLATAELLIMALDRGDFEFREAYR